MGGFCRMYYQYPTIPISRNPAQVIQYQNRIKVYGDGIVTAVPNQVSATIGVITEGKDIAQVQKENAEITNQILAILNKHQIPEKYIQTYDYQINMEYDYVDGKQIFRGYRVQNLLKLTLVNIKQLGVILNQVIEAGANYVSNITFSVSDPSPYYVEAIQEALKNAHKKAESIVNELKVSWNPTPVRIEELRMTITPVVHQYSYVKGVSTESFQPGILEFQSEIKVVYVYQ
jgi:uncharacterized protein